jgi:predicted dehydrogenase
LRLKVGRDFRTPLNLPGRRNLTLSVALVGCGKVADDHISEIRKLNNARVVAVCDLEILMAEQLATRYQLAHYYSDVDRMLEVEKPDVVHITTPPQSHLSLAKRSIDAGCHVYVEKPLAPNHAEAKELVDYAVQANKKLTIGYTYYFEPVAQAARHLVHDGSIGDLVHLESFFGYDLSGPFGLPVISDRRHWLHRLPGKLAQNVIDHLLNKVVEFMPAGEITVAAHAYQHSPILSDSGLPDELRAMLFAKDVSAYATFSSHTRPVHHFLTLYGTKNTVHMDLVGQTLTFTARPAMPGALGRLSPAFTQGWEYFRQGGKNLMRFAKSEFQYFAGLNFLLFSFYESIIHDSKVPIPYDVILRVSSVMDQIFEQVGGSEKRPA